MLLIYSILLQVPFSFPASGGYGGRPQQGGDKKISFRNSFGQNQNPFGALSTSGGGGVGGGGGGGHRQQTAAGKEPTMGEIL